MNDFLWGVSTSAYQVEGGFNGPNEPKTNWAKAEAHGQVARTGAAADFWNRYEEDFARSRALGLTAFRLGLEWSRIQPCVDDCSGTPPPFDTAALDHYARMLESCRQQGMEPVVTLHHFTHPAWLGADAWLDAATPEYFARYVRTALEHISTRLERPIHWFITINEPNMLVLNSYLGRQFPAGKGRGFSAMITAYNHLLRGHVMAYNAIHDLYEERGWPTPCATFNNYCSDLYWSDKMLLDLVCARERGIAREEISAHIIDRARAFEKAFESANIRLRKDPAYFLGSFLKRISNWIGYKRFSAEGFSALLDTIYASPRLRLIDYVGLDYYDPFAAHAFRLPVLWDHEFRNHSFREWILNSITSKWWDWRVLPRGLHFFCKHYSEDFARPVIIAENGMALRRRIRDERAGARRDRMTRSQFLRLHVHEVARMVREGIPVKGYLHWSLFDNYEWGTYTPRFGLFSINFHSNLDRLAENPGGDRPAETYAALIREAAI